MKCLAVMFILIFAVIRVSKSERLDQLSDVLQKWVNFEKSARVYIKMIVKELRNPMLKLASKLKLSSKCQNHLLRLAIGLNRAEMWAMNFISSNGFITNGLTSTRTSDYGSFQQCVEDTIPNPTDKNPPSNLFFQGMYCSVEISPPLPSRPRFYTINEPLSILKNFSESNTTVVRRIAAHAQVYYFSPFRVGFCMPSSCSVEDVHNLSNAVVTELFPLKVHVRRCETKDLLVVNKEQMIVSCIFGIFFVLFAGGTLLDIFTHYFPSMKGKVNEGALTEVLLAFSINRSVQKLLRIDKTTRYLRPLYGIRFLTMMWLFLGWSYEESSFKYFHGELRNREFGKSVFLTPFLNYTVAIETLFLTSGLLTCYKILRRTNDDKKATKFFFNVACRLKRVVPSLMFVIAMTVYLPWIGSGPVWHDVIDPVVEGCKWNWWTNLLHINNYVGTDKPCLKNSWFLAADFQLYLMALIIVSVISRRPKIGMACNIIICFSSIAASGIITWLKKLPPTLLFVHPDPNDRKEFLTCLYHLPYPHAAACCVGIAVGYILFVCPKMAIKWWLQILGWISSATVSFFVVYGIYGWNQGYEMNTVAGMWYACIHRTAWALALSWLVLACCTGYGGIINTFLSWGAFEPLSRLSFLAYIIYNLTSAALLGSYKEELLYQHHFVVTFMVSTTFITYAASFFAGCLWQTPLLAIEQIVQTRKINVAKSLNIYSKKEIEGDGIYVVKRNY